MSFEEDFIAHYGVKGMKWGVSNKKFKRDVKLTRKGRGIERKYNWKTVPGSYITKTVNGKEIRIRDSSVMRGTPTNTFRDSNKQKIGREYAEAVIAKAESKNRRARSAKIGALYAGVLLISLGGIAGSRIK